MLKNMLSSKVLISIALIAGLILGYTINNVLTRPKINELDEKTQVLEELQQNYAKLQSNYNELDENFDSLNDEFESLKATSIPLSEYNSLLNDYQALEEETETLNSEVNQLQDELFNTNLAKNELQTEYTRLLEEYNKIRVLSWTFFIIEGLEVNLTTVKNEYVSIEDITGDMSIYYLNGEPFTGSFSLILWSDYYDQGRGSVSFQINGETEYVFDDPFMQRTGSYYLRVREIKDEQGNIIASYSDLLDYRIPIQMG
jgi:uncharacterized membrane-anchored protein YhcB (DUF1043 family)